MPGYKDVCDNDGIQTQHAACGETPGGPNPNGPNIVVSAHFVYSARVGGAGVTMGAIRVTFWGALAMVVTAGVGWLFGTAA